MGVCIGAVFIEKKNGAYISHEFIVRLIQTWIWYDQLTVVSQIWPSDHEIPYFFEFYQFKVV